MAGDNMIRLRGCTSMPLMNYLKALGVFRIVHEQMGKPVAGYWENGEFILVINASKEDLSDFFVNRYKPTPFVTPWNGGSGFYPSDDHTYLERIKNSQDNRLHAYRDVIQEIKNWQIFRSLPRTIGDLHKEAVRLLSAANVKADIRKKLNAIEDVYNQVNDPGRPIDQILSDPQLQKHKELKNEFKKGHTHIISEWRSKIKSRILKYARMNLPDNVLQWLDAAVVLLGDDATMNPLLGSGGNDGNYDFSNAFMKSILWLFEPGHEQYSTNWLRGSLFDEPISGLDQIPDDSRVKAGLFNPSMAGGENQGIGLKKVENVKINPWNFILMLEGTLLFAGSIGKFLWQENKGSTQLPFIVNHFPAGFASPDGNNSGGGKELWVPLWRSPVSFPEITVLLREGRSTVGRKPAKDGLDFLKSVKSIGVERGLDSFIRYLFLVRRGKSKVAMPVGVFSVENNKNIRLLDDFEHGLFYLASKMKGVSGNFASLHNRMQESVFNMAANPTAENTIRVLRSIGRFMKALSVYVPSKDNPPSLNPGLSMDWIGAAGAMPEIRLAAALASLASTGDVGPMAAYMFYVDHKNIRKWNYEKNQRFWFGHNLVERLSNVFYRRVLDAIRTNTRSFPFYGRFSCSVQDVMRFLYADTNDDLLEDLLWAFTLIDWRHWKSQPHSSPGRLPVNRTYALFKTLYRSDHREGVKMETSIPALLMAGRIEDAAHAAKNRLIISDLHPLPIDFHDPTLDGKRLLASLLIPVREVDYLENLVLKQDIKQQPEIQKGGA